MTHDLVSRWQKLPPGETPWLRYVGSLGLVGTVASVAHFYHLGDPWSGILAMLAVIVGSWLGGLIPALFITPMIIVISRLSRDSADRWVAMTNNEYLAITIIALISVSVGLAGQFRRGIRTIARQNAQKLKDQARALNEAPIVFRDLEDRITQWNEGSQRLFGWQPEEAIGRRLHDLLQTQFPVPREEIEADFLRAGQWKGEVIQRHQDGRELHIATHWILYRDHRGQPIGVTEVQNDVTALRKAEAAVREADRRKDEFLAVLAHELRNPLAPIRTGLELMRIMEYEPEEFEETRAIMERQTKHLVTLVDDLLDVSRISRGKLELRKSEVLLSEVIQCALETSKPIIAEAGHHLTVEVPEGPISLNADAHRLAQVLSNLLDNAAKYTPSGGRIGLHVQRQGDEVVLVVRDTGIGIPLEMQQRIFDMFTRTGRSIEIAQSGLGIGLALTKSIVEMHDGRIEVFSEGPDRGAEFKVVLPLIVEASQPEPSAYEPSANGARRVLIVDDNQAAANLMRLVVKRTGNEVRVAYDGLAAIEEAGRFRPDVVLMDLGMPRLDGYGAAEQIRQQPWGKDILLVAVSGWGQEGHKQRTKKAGFDYHLVKPADPEEIQRLVTAGRDAANAPNGDDLPATT